MANMEDAVMKAVAKKVIGDIDIDTLAKKIRPAMLKQFENSVLKYFDQDTIFEMISGGKMYKIVEQALEDTLVKTLGYKEPKKTKKRRK